jgi:hypothetical protein
VLADTVKNGPFSKNNLLDANNHFRKNWSIENDRKVIATNEAINSWLASHYSIQVENVPNICP